MLEETRLFSRTGHLLPSEKSRVSLLFIFFVLYTALLY
ncbi:Uncharacterized protein dnm_068120 [Desulfonema magnum]|uniref:Uncharacterized protein n=1 Tax=Desulfonema magnum TaxID=45655 RepID=A0A975BS97_9BACT|nr:Uncharacterized protein dnm_068120 [Desulfonema magnum]